MIKSEARTPASTRQALATHTHLRVGMTSIALAVMALGALVSQPAKAQTSGGSDSGAQEATQSVVVTGARKRKELVQDVPITMDVVTGKELKESGITQAIDLQFNIPGLAIQSYESGGRVALRGVGSQTAGLGTDTSSAIHLDGVYQGLSGIALTRLFDMDSVEVLKGPQGTLYGRNATGGVVNLTSRAPGKKFGGSADISFGSYNTVRTEGGLDVPFAEGSGMRVAFSTAKGDGRITNTFNNTKVGNEDYDAVRLRVKSRLGSVAADLSVQSVTDRSNVGVTFVAPPSIASSIPYGDTFVAPTSLGYEKTYAPRTNASKKDDQNLALTLTAEVGEVTLKSITGYGKHKALQDFDCSVGNPFGCSLKIDENHKQTTQELQALFTTGQVDWVLGAFYFDASGGEHRVIDIPAFVPPPPFLIDATPTVGAKAYALFADANWQIAPGWRLNPGIRFNSERKSATSVGTGAVDNPTPVTTKRSFTDVSGRLGLDYQPTKRDLYFVSLSKGFKSGGVIPTLLGGGTDLNNFEPETLYALEAGFKRALAGDAGRVNMSAFYYDYKNLQVDTGTFDPANNQVNFFTRNAAKARVYGLDFFADLKLNALLSVDFNGELLSAKYVKFPTFDNNQQPVDYSGNSLPRAPKVSFAAGLNVNRLALGAGLFSTLRIEVTHRSKVFFDQDNAAPFLSQEAFSYLNASARIEPTNAAWSAYFTGRNLTNKKTIDFGSSALNVPGSFRTWQLGANLKF